MNSQQRIRLARRHAGLSQAALAEAVGVQRSAVSHWEAVQGKSPSMANLRRVATVTGVQFEWIATGRGRMSLTPDEQKAFPTATQPDFDKWTKQIGPYLVKAAQTAIAARK